MFLCNFIYISTTNAATIIPGENWYSIGGTWNYRKKITIDHTKVADAANPSVTYANFPVLISMTGLSNIKANGADIRFTLSDGITEIPREIEKYDNGALTAWVKLTLTKDASDSTNDEIYMYYGNVDAVEPLASSEFGRENVWDDGFVGVWHLSEGSGDTIYDSTSNGNNGTAVGTPTWGNGEIILASGDYFDCGVINMANWQDASVSAHFKSTDLGADNYIISNYATWKASFKLYIQAAYKRAGYTYLPGGVGYVTYSKITATNSILENNWYFLTSTGGANDSLVRIYKNCAQIATRLGEAPFRSEATTDSLKIGNAFIGNINEIRLSNIIRSADWIETEYNNQNNQNSPSAFLVFDSVETSLSCAGADGTCKTNICSSYVDCSSMLEVCDTGNCCLGTCTDDIEVPTTPTNLSATDVSSSQIDLSWTASTDNIGVIEYKIYRDTVEIDTTTNTTYSDTGLSHSTLYTYTVSAYDAIPNESAQSSPDSTTTEDPDIIPPANITNLSVSSRTSNSCSLIWTAPGDNNNTGIATSYDIRYSTANITEENWGSATQMAGESFPKTAGLTEAYTVAGLDSETIYYFAIKTADEVPNTSGLSNVASEETGRGINAASCVRDDVQAAINLAVDGDIVAVPAGECTWSSGVSLSKGITLQGAGMSETIITADDSGFSRLIASYSNDAIITGFHLKAPAVTPFTVYMRGDNWRVHHNKFECITAGDKLNGVFAQGMSGKYNPTGLIDNNIFIDARAITVGSAGLLTESDTQNEIYAEALDLGGSSAVYIEDNIFTTTVGGNVIDGNYASSYVARFNTITMPGWGSHFEAHSMQGYTNRAHRKWEIYGNNITGIGKWVPMFIRGGTGVIFDNSLFGSFTAEYIYFDNVRSDNDAGGTAGKCDGSSLWDGNLDATGWPCRDQIGTGPDLVQWENDPPIAYTQTSVPAYIWSNSKTTGAELTVSVRNNSGDHIKANRDYYEYTTYFDGTSGVGVGTLANRPSTCTIGVAYWATDQGSWNKTPGGEQGVLYKCTTPNNWEKYYEPYDYPHPLSRPALLSKPTPPRNLRIIN